mmetsp:Transcript_9562/g.26707  ORF Transcript_9562/g.26707 Transcript_9562/m.26707 type:complete len:202 (+) Transcript_9562:610-1215(+)
MNRLSIAVGMQCLKHLDGDVFMTSAEHFAPDALQRIKSQIALRRQRGHQSQVLEPVNVPRVVEVNDAEDVLHHHLRNLWTRKLPLQRAAYILFPDQPVAVFVNLSKISDLSPEPHRQATEREINIAYSILLLRQRRDGLAERWHKIAVELQCHRPQSDRVDSFFVEGLASNAANELASRCRAVHRGSIVVAEIPTVRASRS